MEPRPKLELLTVGLQVDVCGGVILPLFRGQVDLGEWKSNIIEPGYFSYKYFGLEPKLLEGYSGAKAAKISGVIILVGVGGWLCYRFIRTVWLSLRSKNFLSKSPSFASLDSSDSDEEEGKELLEEDNADYVEIKHAYFGPSRSLDIKEELSLNSPETETPDSTKKFNAWKRQGPSLFQNSPTNPFSYLIRDQSQHTGGFSTSSPQLASLYNSNNNSYRNSCNSSSNSSPFIGFPRDRSKLNFTFDQPYESFGYSSFGSYVGGSLESIASELSIDISTLCETPHEETTISVLEKLQQEIAQLKTNCNSMTEDFTQVKSNRYLPGLSNLLETSNCRVDPNATLDENFDRQRARECFKGLYSLTTLSNSISFDLSECDVNSPTDSITRRAFDFRQEEFPSLEWDECGVEVEDSVKSLALNGSSGYNSTLIDSCSTSQLMAGSNIWSTEGDLTPETEIAEATGLTSQELSDSPKIKATEVDEATGVVSQEQSNSPKTEAPSQNKQRTLEISNDNALSPFKKFKAKGNSTPTVQNISCDIDLLEYARLEWQGHTQTARTILRGYEEIRKKYNYRYLRRIRGDNYCAIRATLFQCLSAGVSLPSCDEALCVIKSSFESDNNHWLRQWSFINRLPYNQNKLLPSIETCLHTLDDISAQLKLCTTDCSNVLAELMNCEPELDLLMMEAVKLHMIVSAIKLYSNQSEMPTFGMLMFARDTSETPKDFMNNHLLPVGDTAGLEQIEMFLLGYTLGAVIKVFRVSAFGTSDFVCYFPDREENRDLPVITIIAEDDRHYNVLVK